jgi:uncharacterized protein YdeI (YjbR/CyaY-like superfamily)
MTPAGLKAFAARQPENTGIYSFENRPRRLDAARERTFRAQARAWAWFQAQPPGYRRLMVFWVMSARQEATRERRLRKLIEASAEGVRLQ